MCHLGDQSATTNARDCVIGTDAANAVVVARVGRTSAAQKGGRITGNDAAARLVVIVTPGVLLRPSKMTSDFFLPRPLRNGHRCIIAFETISASRGDEPCRHCRGGRDWSHVQVGMVLARAARLTVRHRPSRERLLGEQLHRRLRGGGPKLTVFDLL